MKPGNSVEGKTGMTIGEVRWRVSESKAAGVCEGVKHEHKRVEQQRIESGLAQADGRIGAMLTGALGPGLTCQSGCKGE